MKKRKQPKRATIDVRPIEPLNIMGHKVVVTSNVSKAIAAITQQIAVKGIKIDPKELLDYLAELIDGSTDWKADDYVNPNGDYSITLTIKGFPIDLAEQHHKECGNSGYLTDDLKALKP